MKDVDEAREAAQAVRTAVTPEDLEQALNHLVGAVAEVTMRVYSERIREKRDHIWKEGYQAGFEDGSKKRGRLQ